MAKTAKNTLANKLNNSLAAHSSDETDYGQEFIDLPPGIKSGVAAVIEAKLGTYQKGVYEGERFLYLAGAVVEPVEHTYAPQVFVNGKVQTQDVVTVNIEGQRTSLMVPWCETTKQVKGQTVVVSLDDNASTLLNELRKLGVDTESVVDVPSLEAVLVALVEVAPYFKFSTNASTPSAQYPIPRTWERWHGDRGLEDYESLDSDEVVDETEEPEEEESIDENDIPEGSIWCKACGGTGKSTKGKKCRICKGLGYVTNPEFDSEEPEEDDSEEEQSLEELAAEADAEEEDGSEDAETIARTKITEIAEKLDINPDEYGSWEEVAEAIQEKESEGGDNNDRDDPAKDEVYEYKPPRARKLVDVVVIESFPRKKTVTLKNLEDGKTLYKDIPWDDLVEALFTRAHYP